MRTYAYIVTMLVLILSLFVSKMLMIEADGPTSKLPEDRFHFYTHRASELGEEAKKCVAVSDGSGYQHNIEAQKTALSMAEAYREEFNRQLAIRTSRALAITGDSTMFHQVYDTQKL